MLLKNRKYIHIQRYKKWGFDVQVFYPANGTVMLLVKVNLKEEEEV